MFLNKILAFFDFDVVPAIVPSPAEVFDVTWQENEFVVDFQENEFEVTLECCD